MAIGELFGAVGSLAGGVMGAIGDEQAASAYRRAARFEQGVATATAQQYFPEASKSWLKSQEVMTQVYATEGTMASQVAGGNFKMAGSPLALQKSSFRRGATANAAVAGQFTADMNALMEKSFSEAMQIDMDKQMAKKEETAAMSSLVGGAIGAVGGVAKAFGAAQSSGADIA